MAIYSTGVEPKNKVLVYLTEKIIVLKNVAVKVCLSTFFVYRKLVCGNGILTFQANFANLFDIQRNKSLETK